MVGVDHAAQFSFKSRHGVDVTVVAVRVVEAGTMVAGGSVVREIVGQSPHAFLQFSFTKSLVSQ